MGKFIEETYPTIEERINRWESLGMLVNVKSYDSKKLVSMALDYTTIYTSEFNFMGLNKDTKTILFPVILRLFNKTNKEFTFEFLSKSVIEIILDFAKKYEEAKPNFNKTCAKCDDETEFVVQYCEKYSFDNL